MSSALVHSRHLRYGTSMNTETNTNLRFEVTLTVELDTNTLVGTYPEEVLRGQVSLNIADAAERVHGVTVKQVTDTPAEVK